MVHKHMYERIKLFFQRFIVIFINNGTGTYFLESIKRLRLGSAKIKWG